MTPFANTILWNFYIFKKLNSFRQC